MKCDQCDHMYNSYENSDNKRKITITQCFVMIFYKKNETLKFKNKIQNETLVEVPEAPAKIINELNAVQTKKNRF